MGEMISITKNEYKEYLELKKERDEAIKQGIKTRTQRREGRE